MPKVQSARTKKYKRCVRKVRKQGTADDPEDVCAAAIFHKDNVTMAKKRKKKWKGTPAQRAANRRVEFIFIRDITPDSGPAPTPETQP